MSNALDVSESDETLSDRATIELAQPSKRMSRSMTQDQGLGQTQPRASASEPLIPQGITRSITHINGPKHQLFSLLLISAD